VTPLPPIDPVLQAHACACLTPNGLSLGPANGIPGYDVLVGGFSPVYSPACLMGAAEIVMDGLDRGYVNGMSSIGEFVSSPRALCTFVYLTMPYLDACPTPWWNEDVCQSAPIIGGELGKSSSSRVLLRRATRDQIAFFLHLAGPQIMGLDFVTDSMFPARVFYDANIAGGTFLDLDKRDLKDMGYSISSAHRFTRAIASYELMLPLVTPSEMIALESLPDATGQLHFTQQFLSLPANTPPEPTTVYLQLDIEQLITIDEVSYEFELEFGMHALWEDVRIEVMCTRTGADNRDVSDDDVCADYWRPRFKFANAVGDPMVVDDRGLQTVPGSSQPFPPVWGNEDDFSLHFTRAESSLGTTFQRLRGRFMGSLSFKSFPSDVQELHIIVRAPTLQTLDKVRYVAEATISDNIVEPASWRIVAVDIIDRANKMQYMPELSRACSSGDQSESDDSGTCDASACTSPGGDVDVTAVGGQDCWAGTPLQACTCSAGRARLTGQVQDTGYGTLYEYTCCTGGHTVGESCGDYPKPGVCKWRDGLYPSSRSALGGESIDDNRGDENQNSEFTLVVRVERIKTFYLLNFVMMVVALTSLSFFTFFLPTDAIDTRLSISLTVVLSINVFQVMLVERLPDTGYNTNMHWFTILCTMLVVLVCMQNLVTYRANLRSAAKQLIAQRLTLIRKDAKKMYAIRVAQRHFLQRITALRAANKNPAGPNSSSAPAASLGAAVGIRPVLQSSGVKVSPKETWSREATAPSAKPKDSRTKIYEASTKQPTATHLKPTTFRHHLRRYAKTLDNYADKAASKAAEMADAHAMWAFPLVLVFILSFFDKLNWALEPTG